MSIWNWKSIYRVSVEREYLELEEYMWSVSVESEYLELEEYL